jgi:4-aminobutyrate aminotransferase-like enzyme
VAAFFAESVPGCAGQIVLPDGYLEAAYGHVREVDAVCVADEVQVGFGRVGSHWWAYETQGVVPDIVTLGKPIGNGHPMGAVVTTPEIADAFDNGMEYFNTFGGNPVSCAVALAVLDVIEEEGLQARAAEVGAHLKSSLMSLAERHPLIGDVRGLGLFLGIELVREAESLTPATREAAEAIELMKDRGVLLSIDGPFENVIKIKPPLVFSRENADELVAALAEVLGEIEQKAGMAQM